MALMTRAQLLALEEKYVMRTIRCVPEKFFEMCHMHLSFLLDLSGDKLEVLLSSDDEQKKRKPSLASICVFKKKEKPSADLFGLPLTNEGVCLMVPLINFLKLEENVCMEGIFRIPGNKSRMTALREQLVSQGTIVSIDTSVYSAYDVACVLKEFLRELPEPLLTMRHMEAHRQILDLGKHATAQDDVTRYSQKKLSALQLLMLLVPSPVKKLTLQLLELLKRIAHCEQTRMTPSTLGTIFAPIFLIDRNIEATEICSHVSLMTPAVSFMIENVDQLIHAPRELVVDLAHYWNGQASPNVDSVPGSSYSKYLSSRTVHTTVCYIDRELSRCDVASHTQTELANLLAHVQSLPDTSGNMKLKKQMMKNNSTPVSSTKKHSHSTSLSASIKKRLPSLGRSRNKHQQVLEVFHSDTKVNKSKAPTMRELLESPVHHSEQRDQRQLSSRPRRRAHHTSENSEISADAECSSPKQKCKRVSSCETVAFASRDKNGQIHDNTNTSTVAKMLDHVNDPCATTRPRKCLSPRDNVHQLENEINYVPHFVEKKIAAPLTPKKDSVQVAKVHHRRPAKGARAPTTTRRPLQYNNSLETSI